MSPPHIPCILCAAKVYHAEPVALAMAVMLRTHEDGRDNVIAKMCPKHRELTEKTIALGVKEGAVAS
jgi:hypothetical protein